MTENELFDPLDYANLTRHLVRELMERKPSPLPPPVKFQGPGVYALFYNGGFKPYLNLRSPDYSRPIYVGKAVESGARKGKRGEGSGFELFGRLREHADSINAASNLELADFKCRYLPVVPLWIVMAERFLIEHYMPLWNVCMEGFGVHDPGGGRREGEISWWDALHPGRAWAVKQKKSRTNQQALQRLDEYLAGPSFTKDSD